MSQFDFDIDNRTIEILPPDKRNTNNHNFLFALLSAVKWVHSLFFKSYYEGSEALEYVAGTYNYQDEVVYLKKVYSSLIDNNTDVPTSNNWILIQDDFIGLKERILYNGSKLVLEYALNKEFNTTFRQPTAVSDIYINNVLPVIAGFLVGKTEPNCSSVGQTISSDTIGGTLPSVYLVNFNINIPAAAYALTNSQAISNFVKKYIPEGLIFTITPY